jgi:hypothetical protein
MIIKDNRLPDRFWSKVKLYEPTQCWVWTASLNNKGYAKFRWNDKISLGHIVCYKILVGEIPDGLCLDHVKSRGCIFRCCVNPAHLEPVTQGENCARARKTHCKRGHELVGENLLLQPTGKRCKKCLSMLNRMYYLKGKNNNYEL